MINKKISIVVITEKIDKDKNVKVGNVKISNFFSNRKDAILWINKNIKK